MKKIGLFFCTILISVSLSLGGSYYLYKNNNDINNEATIKTTKIVEENDLTSAIKEVYDSVVIIESYNNDQLVGTGTGFVYKKDENYGYILTNHHVISKSETIKIVDNYNNKIEAELLGIDDYSDIAVLSIKKEYVIQVAKIGSSTDLALGNTLFTVGSPLGVNYQGSVTKGILSGKNRTVSVGTSDNQYIMEVLQTDAAINPGNSGGPLVNINGEVIGINSMKLIEDKIEGMGFAIPIEIAMTSVDFLEKGEKVERPVIGIEVIDVNNKYSLYLNKITIEDDVKEGLVIISVKDDYPAKKSGLEKGDIISKINGNSVKDMAEFRHVLYKSKIGDKITISYYRNGKLKEAELNLDKTI